MPPLETTATLSQWRRKIDITTNDLSDQDLVIIGIPNEGIPYDPEEKDDLMRACTMIYEGFKMLLQHFRKHNINVTFSALLEKFIQEPPSLGCRVAPDGGSPWEWLKEMMKNVGPIMLQYGLSSAFVSLILSLIAVTSWPTWAVVVNIPILSVVVKPLLNLPLLPATIVGGVVGIVTGMVVGVYNFIMSWTKPQPKDGKATDDKSTDGKNTELAVYQAAKVE